MSVGSEKIGLLSWEDSPKCGQHHSMSWALDCIRWRKRANHWHSFLLPFLATEAMCPAALCSCSQAFWIMMTWSENLGFLVDSIVSCEFFSKLSYDKMLLLKQTCGRMFRSEQMHDVFLKAAWKRGMSCFTRVVTWENMWYWKGYKYNPTDSWQRCVVLVNIATLWWS
jgi:hypothetical protein